MFANQFKIFFVIIVNALFDKIWHLCRSESKKCFCDIKFPLCVVISQWCLPWYGWSSTDEQKHRSSTSLAFVKGIHGWISRTKGQKHGKCFHLRTSSWYNLTPPLSNQISLIHRLWIKWQPVLVLLYETQFPSRSLILDKTFLSYTIPYMGVFYWLPLQLQCNLQCDITSDHVVIGPNCIITLLLLKLLCCH